MLELNFDIFRQIPFGAAKLILSTRQELSVVPNADKTFPLRVSFDDHVCTLSRDKQGYTPQQREPIDAFRKDALPVLRKIRYQLINIHRSTRFHDPRSRNVL